MIGKQTPQNSNKPIKSLYYSRKQITKGVRFLFQTFAGSGHILLKRCYPTLIIWYAKSALTRRKFFIEWGYDNSHHANRYQTYQATRPGSCHYTWWIYTPGRGNVNMTSQYLIAITIIWHPPLHPKVQYDPNRQLTKWGALRESYQKIPQEIPLSQMDYVTEETWITTRSLMRICV